MKTLIKQTLNVTLLMSLAFLTACGDSGSSSSDTTVTTTLPACGSTAQYNNSDGKWYQTYNYQTECKYPTSSTQNITCANNQYPVRVPIQLYNQLNNQNYQNYQSSNWTVSASVNVSISSDFHTNSGLYGVLCSRSTSPFIVSTGSYYYYDYVRYTQYYSSNHYTYNVSPKDALIVTGAVTLGALLINAFAN